MTYLWAELVILASIIFLILCSSPSVFSYNSLNIFKMIILNYFSGNSQISNFLESQALEFYCVPLVVLCYLDSSCYLKTYIPVFTFKDVIFNLLSGFRKDWLLPARDLRGPLYFSYECTCSIPLISSWVRNLGISCVFSIPQSQELRDSCLFSLGQHPGLFKVVYLLPVPQNGAGCWQPRVPFGYMRTPSAKAYVYHLRCAFRILGAHDSQLGKRTEG